MQVLGHICCADAHLNIHLVYLSYMEWNEMEWNGFELCFISKSILEIIDLLQTMLMERQYVYVAVCIRYICSCDICILHIVNYRVTAQDFLFISSA